MIRALLAGSLALVPPPWGGDRPAGPGAGDPERVARGLPAPAAARRSPPQGGGTAGFQAACERLAGTRPAAIVALDARTGVLRALVHPDLAARATPPGSIFKLLTAAAALGRGDAPALTCRGWLHAPGAGGRAEVLRCWKPEGHGRLALEGALAASCNLYFVQLGRRAGHAALAATAGRAGLDGARVDPRDARAAIGEGAGWRVSPLQAAGIAAAIAVDVPVRVPAWTPAAAGPALAAPAVTARLRAGMRLAALGGSARRAAVAGLEVAGKTGTATYRDGSNRTFGWFVGHATRAGAPTLALAVRLDDASGFGDAAALAGRVFAAWRDAGTP